MIKYYAMQKPNYRLPEYNLMSSVEANQWYYEQGRISKVTRDFYNQRTEKMISLYNSQKSLVQKVKEKDFYRIDFDIDHNKVKEELESVLHLKHNVNRGSTKGWYNISLYDVFEKTSDSGVLHRSNELENFKIDYHSDGSPVWKITDAGKMCPYTISKVLEMTDNPNRIRFSMLPPGGSMVWHTHLRLPNMAGTIKQNDLYHEFAVHLPIKTNKDCYAMVSNNENYLGPDEGVTDFVGKHMPLGEVWGMNSAKNHMVWNNGTTERWHLYLWCTYLGYEKKNKFSRFL